MRHIRQCCGHECNNNTHCEEDAWRRYQKQRMNAYKKMLTNPIIILILVWVTGFITGKLS
jgi:hypothetical protein